MPALHVRLNPIRETQFPLKEGVHKNKQTHNALQDEVLAYKMTCLLILVSSLRNRESLAGAVIQANGTEAGLWWPPYPGINSELPCGCGLVLGWMWLS